MQSCRQPTTLPALLRHDELDVRIAVQPFERVVIKCRQRIFEPLAGTAEMIVGKHRDNGGDVVAARGTEGDGRQSHSCSFPLI